MKQLLLIIKRNTKVFFKDKAMFFTSLVTPLILLVLYTTFLSELYRESFAAAMPTGVTISEKILSGAVGGQLFSSLLAVSCVTVSFCANMLSVTDKVSGVRADLTVTPVKKQMLALGYYLSTLLTTLIISFVAIGACLVYLAIIGWYLSVLDVMLLFLDVFLLVMFGTVLSSIVNFFLTTQGQISAVGTIVSACYGFICGAYMPISQFGEGVRTAVSFLPGTYATALLRNHAMRGAFQAMEKDGIPESAIHGMRDMVDCNLYFFDTKVEEGTMYLILGGSVLLLIAVYLLMNIVKKTSKK